MNFLAHYYTAPPSISAYNLLGLIMPDLVQNFSKIYNKELSQNYSPSQVLLQEMKAGVDLHIKGDDVFHKHKLFLKHEQNAKEVLVSNKSLKALRKYILAHVLVELLIDQYIILNYDDVLAAFYKKLNLVNLDEAACFFTDLGLAEENTLFKRNSSIFIERKFLYKLKENEGVIFTLDKVFGKLFSIDFMGQYALWNNLTEEIKEDLTKDLPFLLEDLKKKINE